MELKKAPDMGREQLARNNKYLTLIMTIMYVFFMVGTFMELTMSKEASKVASAITLLFALVMLITNLCLFRFQRDNKQFILIAFTGFTVVYCFTMLTSMTTMYAYVFPVLIIVCTYMNQKLSFFAVVFTAIINVLNIVKTIYRNGGMDDTLIQIVSVQVITITLACIGTYFITIIIAEGTEKNLLMTKEQVRIVDNATCIAEEMHSNFKELKEELFRINNNIHENSTSLTSISESVKYTATEISKQLTETEKIKTDMEGTSSSASNVYQETNEIVETLHTGMKQLEELQEQSSVVNQQIDQTTERLAELTKQVSEVANIANSIIDISNQTNLLSLNASIEAARAGEAGKGFAVVSEQIRILADETKNASTQITEIIEELNHISSQTSISLEGSIHSIQHQGELLKFATGSYQDTYNHVQILTKHVDTIKINLQDTMTANLEIVDSVSNLSSSSEEVSASTDEVSVFNMDVSKQMEHFVQKINAMDELMNDLEKAVVE